VDHRQKAPTLPRDAPTFPHFRHVRNDPEPAGRIGIAIASGGLVTEGPTARWPLHGRFRIAAAELAGQPEEALRRVVLVLSGSGHTCQARHVVRDALVFPEDVVVRDGLISGSFHVDLLTIFEFADAIDQYHLFASLGEHLSNTISLPAAMPWLYRPAAEAGAAPASEPELDGDEPVPAVDDESWRQNDPEFEAWMKLHGRR
jgi:hypothetical protein